MNSEDYRKGWEDGLDRAACELRVRSLHEAESVVEAIPRIPGEWSGERSFRVGDLVEHREILGFWKVKRILTDDRGRPALEVSNIRDHVSCFVSEQRLFCLVDKTLNVPVTPSQEFLLERPIASKWLEEHGFDVREGDALIPAADVPAAVEDLAKLLASMRGKV